MSRPARGILVVAGEASGDRIAAELARALGGREPIFGIAGRAARGAGVETLGDAQLGVMGLAGLAGATVPLAVQIAALVRGVRRRPPRAAVLIDYTELNGHLGRWLRAQGVFVLWCVAPQIWAWRPGRSTTLKDAMDRLAVILPFEEALWRRAGVDARYVGHPSVASLPVAAEVRGELGLGDGPAVAVVPGSRRSEIARLAEPLTEAARALRGSGAVSSGRVIRAPSLDDEAASPLTRAAERSGLPVVTPPLGCGAGTLLAGFDVALVASGTASLEAALAGAAPVVAYRTDAVSFAMASALVRTSHVALPNVLLGARVFPELLQGRATPTRIADAARFWLTETGRRRAREARLELARLLTPPGGGTFGERLAELLPPYPACASPAGGRGTRPVPRSSAASSSGTGLGVVSSRSP